MKDKDHRPLQAAPLFLAALVGLGVTLRAPLATTVIGLMIFGVLHNLYELRYIAARLVIGRLSTRTIWLIALPILGVVAVRAAGGGLIDHMDARYAEIVLVYSSIAIAAASARAPRPIRIGWSCAAIGAGVASIHWLSAHYLVLTHLHNLMPIPFLLLHHAKNRGAVLGACLAWGLLVPAALLSGLLDPLLDFQAAYSAWPVDTIEAERLRAGWATVYTHPDQATRIAATFSFLQWMHYFIWILYLPRFSSPPQTKSRIWDAFFGPIGFGVALVATIMLVPLYATDYIRAFGTYATFAAFHALVEFPVLLAVLLVPGLLAEAGSDEAVLARDAAL